MNKKKIIIISGSLLFLIIILIIVLVMVLKHHEETDNAYVEGNLVKINSQIAGTITQIAAENTFFVQKGQALVSLDTTDQMIQYDQKKEALANAVRQVIDLFEQVKQKKAQIEEKKVTLFNSILEYNHRKELLPDGAVSLEEFQDAETRYIRDQALLTLAQYELEAAEAQVANTTPLTHPKVRQAIEELKQTYVDLKRSQIVAPVDGIVAQRSVQVGERITPETPMMSIIPIDQMWVDANFRENQLRKIRIGQPVQLHSDIYGSDIEYEGKVIGIGMATGSVASVLPPQNATGNWIKVVQRLPVRISLNPEQLKKHPLRLGLTMEASVDIANTDGPLLPRPEQETVYYSTDIFENQAQGFDEIVHEVLAQNIPGCSIH